MLFAVVQSLSSIWLCDPMDYSPPGSSVHGILQARILEWVAIPFSKSFPVAEQYSIVYFCLCSVTQSCPTLCGPRDCSPPGSSVHGIFQARILGRVCHILLQGTFPTQGWNLSLLHWQEWATREVYRNPYLSSRLPVFSVSENGNLCVTWPSWGALQDPFQHDHSFLRPGAFDLQKFLDQIHSHSANVMNVGGGAYKDEKENTFVPPRMY